MTPAKMADSPERRPKSFEVVLETTHKLLRFRDKSRPSLIDESPYPLAGVKEI